MKIIKSGTEVKLINVSEEIYEIFQMTGFTKLTEVDRK
jgi:anti-anti-sigma regulatory factor